MYNICYSTVLLIYLLNNLLCFINNIDVLFHFKVFLSDSAKDKKIASLLKEVSSLKKQLEIYKEPSPVWFFNYSHI